MRILVISDSHGNTSAIRRALDAQPDAVHVFFLGDLIRDLERIEEDYTDRRFHTVCGNCDFGSFLPDSGIENIGGVKILYTHGHRYSVKYSAAPLLEAARSRGAKIALFGHTHIPLTVYEDGIYLVNPGSAGAPRNGGAGYAVIDITDKGIMPVIIKL